MPDMQACRAHARIILPRKHIDCAHACCIKRRLCLQGTSGKKAASTQAPGARALARAGSPWLLLACGRRTRSPGRAGWGVGGGGWRLHRHALKRRQYPERGHAPWSEHGVTTSAAGTISLNQWGQPMGRLWPVSVGWVGKRVWDTESSVPSCWDDGRLAGVWSTRRLSVVDVLMRTHPSRLRPCHAAPSCCCTLMWPALQCRTSLLWPHSYLRRHQAKVVVSAQQATSGKWWSDISQ
jgi:hypothetical protein